MKVVTKQLGDYFKLPNQGLRTYFDHVRDGQSDEYRTPFYGKDTPLKDILDGWSATLNSIEDQWPTLLEFENDLRAKVGPMSIMLPLKDRMKDIEHYYEDILLSSKPIDSRAEQLVAQEFGLKSIRVKSKPNVLLDMKKSTNSGSPFFTKRKNVVNQTMPAELRFVNDDTIIQNLNGHEWLSCAVVGWRGQEGGPEFDDVKQRVVWMFPFAVNINELQVYQPLISSSQRRGTVPAWVSMDAVDYRITKMFDTKGRDDLVICTDFSKFDQHFGSDMQNSARNILSNLLTPGEASERWMREVFPIKYSIPLAIQMDQLITGQHGMASGSGGTNADETLVHRALQYEAALTSKTVLNPYSQCLGDDGVITFPDITVDKVVQSYSAHGQEMNTDKQYASKHDCTYLRRWHHNDYRVNGICVGVYSTYRALGRLAEQERFYDPDKWSKEMVALRQLSIIENCKWHPLREKFADYCMKGDKYRLGIDIPGFLDDIEAIAQEATDLLPDFLGYTKSMQIERSSSPAKGISNWWIVNYLKSKA